MGKSLKKLLIEITLFISMAALAGHVMVNIWERYVVEDKLANIRSSLDHLKVTVHNMGYAYDELHQGLIDLTRFNTKLTIPSRETSKEESCKRRRELDDKILNHLDVFTRAIDKPRHVLIVDKNTGSTPVSTKAQARNASTTTRNPLKAAAVGTQPMCTNSFKACHNDNECIHNYCILRNSARRCYEDCTSRKRFQKF